MIGETICSTLTLASCWLRHYEDPLTKNQRWYCPICETRYEPQSGMLVEMVVDYVLAPYPPVEFREVKWASVRRCHPRSTTPEDLLAAIPAAPPISEDFLREIVGKHGSWSYNRGVFDAIPRLEWGGLLPSRATRRARLLAFLPSEGSNAAPVTPRCR